MPGRGALSGTPRLRLTRLAQDQSWWDVRTSGVRLPFADCLSELWTILDVVLKDP